MDDNEITKIVGWPTEPEMARYRKVAAAAVEADCVAELRRWKSTHAPRLDALQGMLATAQMEAHAGREAVATLASERAANALLTDELAEAQKQRDTIQAALRAENEKLRAEVAELDELRGRLADILTRTAIALRGPQPPMGLHSWHDLPERAEAAIVVIDVMQRAARIAAAPGRARMVNDKGF